MGKTVVWADNNYHEIYRIVKLLEDEGYQFEEYPTAYGVLDRVKRGNVDLVMINLVLPGSSTYPDEEHAGINLLRDLRASTDVPVLVLTLPVRAELKRQAREIGIDGYLRMPTDPKTLYAEVKKILEPERQQQ